MRSRVLFNFGLLGYILGLLLAFGGSNAFDVSRPNNLVTYWGGNPDEPNRLGAYCDGTVDAIVISGLEYQADSLPTMILQGPGCGDTTFPNSNLAECPGLEADILECQNKGVAILINLDRDLLWNLVLGGSSSTRPFGQVPLDGVVINIVSAQSITGYIALVDRLATLSEEDGKRYFWTAYTSCDFADALAGSNSVFSMLTILFVNVASAILYCGLDHYDNKTQWNYGVWDNWASRQPARADFKLYFSVFALPVSGVYTFFAPSRLAQFASDTMTQYPRYFGGILYNDAAMAASNDGFNVQLRKALPTLPLPSTSSSSSTSTSSAPGTSISSGPVTRQNPSPSERPESHSSHTKLIVGITIPVLVIACAIVATLALLRTRRRRRARRGDEDLRDSTGELIAPYPPPQNETLDPWVRPVKWVERKSNSSPPAILRDSPAETVQPVNAVQAQLPTLQNPEGLAALETEIGRVGLTVPALLASLGRLRTPPSAMSGGNASETVTDPPEYS
ncbi:glycoside hydrolase [Exidia glandulosa HHB12029]|uniref:Glycoside hydrolase n=1 Tax=Exidia glandulosa HHB12029 TaxID=1314781 RepID=A0A165BXI3_EXIGL|nr:glycoside hydrolase [Exidia glandulosa HHB12029]